MKLVHWPLMGGLLHLVQRGGDGKLFDVASNYKLIENMRHFSRR